MTCDYNDYMRVYMREYRVGMARDELVKYWKDAGWYVETAEWNNGCSIRGTLYRGDIEHGAAMRFPIWHLVLTILPTEAAQGWSTIHKFFIKETKKYERRRARIDVSAKSKGPLAKDRDWGNWEGSS
jgi:hypothetical protein